MTATNKRRLYRVLAAFMAAVLLAAGLALPASATTQAQLEKQLKDLQAKEKTIKASLSSASSALSASQQRKNLIDSQIDNAKQQIALLDEEIAELNGQMATLQKDIDKMEADISTSEAGIADTKNKLGQRMRATLKSGNVTTLQMLMNTENYTDYLLKSKMMQCIAENDQTVIDDLQAAILRVQEQKTLLEQDKAALEEKKSGVEAIKSTSTSKKKELDTLYAAAQSEVKKLQSSVSSYNKQLTQIEKEEEKTSNAIEALIRAANSTGTYNGGMMYWPVPTVRAISSYYGQRWGKLHGGIDIANGPIPIYGESIVAAASGTVYYVNSTDTWGGSYGYYVIVDHGRNSKGQTVMTLYAHCSKILVKKGQAVVGGKTVLAKAGSTGHVTGPHLHFEVRINGSRVNPLNYVNPKVN